MRGAEGAEMHNYWITLAFLLVVSINRSENAPLANNLKEMSRWV